MSRRQRRRVNRRSAHVQRARRRGLFGHASAAGEGGGFMVRPLMSTRSGVSDLAGRRLAVLAAAVVAGGVAVVGLPGAASAASSGVIVYLCPGSGNKICAISPAGGQPRVLAQSGYLAGVTSDGKTYGYEGTSGGLWEAPVAGGAPTEVNTGPPKITQTQGSVNPVMSSDGQHFLALTIFTTPFASESVSQWNVAAGPNSLSTTVAAFGTYQTYGWLGAVPLTADFSSPGETPPSWVCIGGQNGDPSSCAQGATSPQIQSSTSGLLWPSGSPDGTQIVATVALPGQLGGSIALFGATTGALINTIATPPAGTGYSVPRFSPDGTQVVFESDQLDATGIPTGQGSIDVLNTDGSGLRTIAQGTNPSWGGTASSSGSGSGQLAAPKVTLTLPTIRIASLRRTGALRIGCRLAGAGRCSLTATITAGDARKLGLKPPRHTKTFSLAHGSAVLHRSGKATIGLGFTPRFLRALGRARHGIRVAITAVSSAPGAKSVTLTRSLVLGP